jgi:hypothetical protein
MITRTLLRRLAFSLAALLAIHAAPATAQSAAAPTPLARNGQPVDWAFVFKLNAAIFPTTGWTNPCTYGGKPQTYSPIGLSYAFATSAQPRLAAGAGYVGSSSSDPLGATFAAIYNSGLHYVTWNDQFYLHPRITGCAESCSAPWGHSKGLLAWDDQGNGVVLQVTTPSWPGAGNAAHARVDDGNTLGCVGDNDIKVSQDFFALRLTPADTEAVLRAMINASVVTNPTEPSLVQNGGPTAIQALVGQLGVRSSSRTAMIVTLSSGVRLISKPSNLQVPPWQLVSSLLGGADLRTATWWTAPKIPSTTSTTPIACWDPALAKPGAVQIATNGRWSGRVIALTGGPPANGNHGKVGVSLAPGTSLTIFGDMNQQGTLSGNCKSSQNGRGGMFFVVDNRELHDSIADLITGDSAPLAGADGH